LTLLSALLVWMTFKFKLVDTFKLKLPKKAK
jgi:hypothetical protein